MRQRENESGMRVEESRKSQRNKSVGESGSVYSVRDIGRENNKTETGTETARED